jgi:hypothetical protein
MSVVAVEALLVQVRHVHAYQLNGQLRMGSKCIATGGNAKHALTFPARAGAALWTAS